MKNQAAVYLGRLGGLKGGPARALALSPEQRQENARKAAVARWSRPGSPSRAADRLVSCVVCHRRCKNELGLFLHKCPGPRGIGTTREQLRSRRKRLVRGKVLSASRATKRDRKLAAQAEAAAEQSDPVAHIRLPLTRAECLDGQRPCPFVSCKWHLFLDVNPRNGAMKLNYPDLEVEQLEKSCALDIADHGGETLEEVAALTNVTRERIRQIEVRAFERLASLLEFHALNELRGDEPREFVPRPEPEPPFVENE